MLEPITAVEIKIKVLIEHKEGVGLGTIMQRAIDKFPGENIIYASIMGSHGGAIMG